EDGRLAARRVHHHLSPVRIVQIPMSLAIEGIGLVEGHAVPAVVQCTDHAAVIRRSAVPVGGDEARSEETDAQRAAPVTRHAATLQRRALRKYRAAPARD